MGTSGSDPTTISPPEDGENLSALIRKIYATPKPIVEKVRELIK